MAAMTRRSAGSVRSQCHKKAVDPSFVVVSSSDDFHGKTDYMSDPARVLLLQYHLCLISLWRHIRHPVLRSVHTPTAGGVVLDQ